MQHKRKTHKRAQKKLGNEKMNKEQNIYRCNTSKHYSIGP